MLDTFSMEDIKWREAEARWNAAAVAVRVEAIREDLVARIAASKVDDVDREHYLDTIGGG